MKKNFELVYKARATGFNFTSESNITNGHLNKARAVADFDD